MKEGTSRCSAWRSCPGAVLSAARTRLSTAPRRTLGKALLVFAGVYAVWSLLDFVIGGVGAQGKLDPATVSVDKLLEALKTTDGYLDKAGWLEEDGTFAPSVDTGRRSRLWRFARAVGKRVMPRPLRRVLVAPFRVVGRRVLLPLVRRPVRLLTSPFRFIGRRLRRRRQEEANATSAATDVKVPNKIVDFTRAITKTSRGQACGAVREVHQIGAVLPGVDPAFLMEVMTNPAYGIKWNPAVRRIVSRQHRRARSEKLFLDLFSDEALADNSWRNPSKLTRTGAGEFDVTAQVTEMPLPMALVKFAGGPRYSADFIAARYDCRARRGYTVATSIGAEIVAEAAGVTKGQELCLSAMMIAPYEGEFNGTRIHLVSHFDPKVPSAALRSIVNRNVPSSIKALYSALHKKALEVQASGRHPFIDC